MKLTGHFRVLREDETPFIDTDNNITEFFEEIVATAGIDFIFTQCSPYEAGQTFINALNPTAGNFQIPYKNTKTMPCVYFLNLSKAERDALTKKSNSLPIYTPTLDVDMDKVVGWAIPRYEASGAKQGYLEPISGTTLVNNRRHGLKFKWNADVASGEFNTIAVGINVMENPFAGISLQRGLLSNNTMAGNVANAAYYLCPGLSYGDTVITTENEILIGDEAQQQKARKIVNLLTGEITPLETTDSRYDMTLRSATLPQMAYDKYHIFINNNALIVYDLETKTNKLSMSYYYDMFIYNGLLYSKYSYNNTTYHGYNLSTFARDTGADILIADMGLPAGMQSLLSLNNNYKLKITPAGENYLVTVIYSDGKNVEMVESGLICSDPTNIKGSVVKVLPHCTAVCAFKIGGELVFISDYTNNTINNTYYYQYLNSSNNAQAFYKQGLKFAKENMMGNLFSFKTFEEQQTIPAGQSVKLEYYYTFEQ